MLYKKYYNKSLIFASLILFLYSTYLLKENINSFEGYWFDEWCTLLNADPNSNLAIFFDRLNGNVEKPYENVPAIYYIILRFFFKLFGYTTENGRLFSLIFFLFSTISFYFLIQTYLNKIQSFFASSIFFSTPLIFWMSNETRVDMFLLFFSIINSIFFIRLINFQNKKNLISLLISNVLLLTIYPLTISLIFSQLIYSCLKKKLSFILIIFASIFIYFTLNYEYFLDKTVSQINHYAVLHLNFFIGYFFNIFFGSVLFGFLFLLFFLYFLIKNLRKNISNDIILYSILSILFTYLMVIISSLFVTPIAAPRYIIFVIPFILILIILNIFIHENNKIFIISIFIISIINISFNYNKQPIQKPKIYSALEIINKFGEKNIFLMPQTKLFTNYISLTNRISTYEIISEEQISKKKINSFALLCLNYPSFAYATKPDEIHENCLKNYEGYKQVNEVNFNDFFIRHLEIIK